MDMRQLQHCVFSSSFLVKQQQQQSSKTTPLNYCQPTEPRVFRQNKQVLAHPEIWPGLWMWLQLWLCLWNQICFLALAGDIFSLIAFAWPWPAQSLSSARTQTKPVPPPEHTSAPGWPRAETAQQGNFGHNFNL